MNQNRGLLNKDRKINQSLYSFGGFTNIYRPNVAKSISNFNSNRAMEEEYLPEKIDSN